MRLGTATDHAGFQLKGYLAAALETASYDVVDCIAGQLVSGDALSWDLVKTFLSARFPGLNGLGVVSRKWLRWRTRQSLREKIEP